MDIIWGARAAATDAWAGTVVGALISPGHPRITHLLIRQGFVFRRSFAMPIERVVRTDIDAVYFDMPSSEMRALRSDGVSDLSLNNRTRAEFHNGVAPRVTGVRISEEDGGLTHLILKVGEDRLLLSLQRVGEIEEDVIAVTDDALEPDDLPSYRRDQDIESDGWEALYASDYISPTDLRSIKIAVKGGRATLTGNVRERGAAEDIGVVLQNVEGVLSVEDETASDRELEMSLTVLLAREREDGSNRLLVHCQLGRVEVSGIGPNDASLHAIMQHMSSMPGVRSVENKLIVEISVVPGEPEQEVSESGP